MSMRLTGTVVALVLGGGIAQGQETPPPRELFDGATLDGWRGESRFWRVEDGALVGESTADNPCSTTTYLVWEGGRVADFELRLEFRITGGNSGIQFRSREPGDLDVVGYQADMEDGPNWTGGLYEQGGRGIIVRRGQRVAFAADGEKTTGVLGDPDELLSKVRVHDWNEYVVRAIGPRIELEVNGARTCEMVDEEAGRARSSGILAFQLHAGPPMKVEYRNIRLTDLGGEVEQEPAEPEPEWLWLEGEPSAGQEAFFRREFELEGSVSQATLWGSCDNELVVWLNGERVAVADDWTQTVRQDVLEALRPGVNVLAARGENHGGPAGLWLELRIEQPDREWALQTDDTWRVAAQVPDDWLTAEPDPHAWGPARSLGTLGVDPWGTPRGIAPPPGEALEGEALEVLDGFEATRIVSVPREEQGSWVSLTVDGGGRLIASAQYGALYRIEPPSLGDPAAEARVERIPVALGEAHGLTWAFDSLYVVVSSGGTYPSGLYRVRDTDGDGELDQVEMLREFVGSGEHGPHAVLPGPDGESLYVIAGNHTDLPEVSRSRVPPWGEDLLLPRQPDANGHGGRRARARRLDLPHRSRRQGVGARRGGLSKRLRLRPSPPTDELFTYDADMEWDVGSALVPADAHPARDRAAPSSAGATAPASGPSTTPTASRRSWTSASRRRRAWSSARARPSPRSGSARCTWPTGPTAPCTRSTWSRGERAGAAPPRSSCAASPSR